jgi:hypothetical protein
LFLPISDDEETTSEEGGADSVVEEFTNVKAIAQAVRKENKFASKALLSKVYLSLPRCFYQSPLGHSSKYPNAQPCG